VLYSVVCTQASMCYSTLCAWLGAGSTWRGCWCGMILSPREGLRAGMAVLLSSLITASVLLECRNLLCLFAGSLGLINVFLFSFSGLAIASFTTKFMLNRSSQFSL